MQKETGVKPQSSLMGEPGASVPRLVMGAALPPVRLLKGEKAAASGLG